MKTIINLHNSVFEKITAATPWLLPTLARFIFAATLFVYYIHSAKLKLGEGFAGIFKPAAGAYFQIFPKAIEVAGYDPSALSTFHHLLVIAGTWAEFVLPVLIVVGLFTRLASIGMIGFIAMQTLTDIYGHGATEYGAWFDRFPDGIIMDQRLFWVFILLTLILRGAGPLSVDGLLSRRA